MQFICDIITVILGYIEISKFKVERFFNIFKIGLKINLVF